MAARHTDRAHEETAAERSGGRAMRAANLFDLRRIIGGVFVAWGVLLDDPRAHGVRRRDRQGRGREHQPVGRPRDARLRRA